jgi:methionyl aminopeptidase
MTNSDAYYDAFRENGLKIAQIRDNLIQFTQTHFRLEDIEAQANRLIREAGGEPAFKRVPGYQFATCISVNDGFVHGLPQGTLKPGDVVTIDTGMYYRGTTTDTARTFVVGPETPDQSFFLNVGKKALKKTIGVATTGSPIRRLSETIQKYVERAGFNVTRNLTGHGVGASMHEPPAIPCFISKDPDLNFKLKTGMVIAIEVMYMQGDWPIKTDSDGWTMRTVDGSLSAVFEDDVLITAKGPKVLTISPCPRP